MKANKKIDEEIKFIFESRMSLQSTQRFFEERRIPIKSFNYFKSNDFKRNYFSKWTPFEQRNFLIKIVGVNYWKKFQEMLEKE